MYLIALLEPHPEHRSTLLAALTQLVEHTRGEAGSLQYQVLVDCEMPNRIVMVEHYADTAARDTHMAAAPVQAVLAMLGEWLATPPLLIWSEALAGFVRS